MEIEPTIMIACIGAMATVLAAVLAFMARPRLDKWSSRNSQKSSGNPGNHAQVVRDECDQIKDMTVVRFDRLEDKIGEEFKAVVEVLRRIEGKLPANPGERQQD